MSDATREALDVTFTARLEKSPEPGGWTYLVWPGSAAFFGTRGLVKVEALVEGVPVQTSFMALGDGRHKFPVTKPTLARIGKGPGDEVTVTLTARLR